MTAALRSIDCTMPDFPSPPTDAELRARIATLERELRQRSSTIATLRRELTRAIEAPTVVGVNVVDGMLTVSLSSGAVLQRRPSVIDTPESFSYGFTWTTIEPVPGTPAQIVADVFAGEENAPEHYVTAQQALLRARTFGMSVIE